MSNLMATGTDVVVPPPETSPSLVQPAPPVASPPGTPSAIIDRQRSLKRAREQTPGSPGGHHNSLHREGSPVKSARLDGPSPGHPALALALTGAAAIAERRRIDAEHEAATPSVTINPGHKVIADLMSASPGAEMSRRVETATSPDHLTSAAASDQLAAAAAAAAAAQSHQHQQSLSQHLAHPRQHHNPSAASPRSATSGPSVENGSLPVTESPVPMDIDHRDAPTQGGYPPLPSSSNLGGPASLSFPPPSQPAVLSSSTPARGMTLPTNPRKHRCPHCDGEFTRHHNLKSHLLTHSQQKPYPCDQCDLRFRRQHDLKRHSKLHTGEKPHICPRCDRKFARGDALARHAKGPGGCAGRRESMGSFGEDDYDDSLVTEGHDSRLGDSSVGDPMRGPTYDGADAADLGEAERHRLSLPTAKSERGIGGDGASATPHSRTYPPLTGRSASSVYPPIGDRLAHSMASTSPAQGSGTGASARERPAPLPAPAFGSAGMLSHSNVTESPQPLEPVHGPQGQKPGQVLAPKHGYTGDVREPAPLSPFDHNTSPLERQHGLAAPGVRNRVRSASRLAGSSGSNEAVAPSWDYVQALESKINALLSRVAALEDRDSAREAQMAAMSAQLAGMRERNETGRDAPNGGVKTQ